MVLYLQQTKMLTVELVPLIVLHFVEKINKRIISFKAPNSEVTMLSTVLWMLEIMKYKGGVSSGGTMLVERCSNIHDSK
jgi:hypothetical protein